ncbi:MAG: lytic murein transglycosylase [Desulfovibrionaceae bacterium]
MSLFAGSAWAEPASSFAPGWEDLSRRLAAEGFAPGYVRMLFDRSAVVYDPGVMARKMDALLETRLGRKAGEKVPVPHEERAELYDAYHTDPELLERAAAYMRSRAELLGRVEARSGVPREVMTALLLVETRLGSITGTIRVFVNLASMAASRDPGPVRGAMRNELPSEEGAWFLKRMNEKADWAFKELAALVRYARANGQDPLSIRGSVYGAIGQCQFLPTSAEAYGVDGDDSGTVDLFTEADAVASIGNYLRHHGWTGKMTAERRYKAIFAYNRSKHYTQAILGLAERLAEEPR